MNFRLLFLLTIFLLLGFVRGEITASLDVENIPELKHASLARAPLPAKIFRAMEVSTQTNYNLGILHPYPPIVQGGRPPKRHHTLLEALQILKGDKNASSRYPMLDFIPPVRKFSCEKVHQAGFYADEEFGCQVFRRCDLNGGLTSYLCPIQTVFNQITLVCDWYYNVQCSQSSKFFDFSNSRLYHSDWPLLDGNGGHGQNGVKDGNCPNVGSFGSCAIGCQSDKDCQGVLKCCSTTCGGRLCKIPVSRLPFGPPFGPGPVLLPPQNNPSSPGAEDDSIIVSPPVTPGDEDDVKTGVCPNNPAGTVGSCVIACLSDASCPGNKKCCGTSCGGRICKAPVIFVVKPGTCPTNPKGSLGSCAIACQSDTDCQGVQKCCSTACGGRLCKVPTSLLDLGPVQAQNDSVNQDDTAAETETNNIAILSTTPGDGGNDETDVSAVKTGVCPANPLGSVGSCAIACRSDAGCPENKKCCQTSCGGRTCKTPVAPVVKRGSCPKNPKGTAGSCAIACQTDASCTGAKKCCSTNCGGRSCTTPLFFIKQWNPDS